MANAEARLRLVVEAVNRSSGVFQALLREAQTVGAQMSKALNVGTATNVTDNSLSSRFGDIKTTIDGANNALTQFNGNIGSLTLKIPPANHELMNMNKMFALENLRQAASALKNFGLSLAEYLGGGMEQSMDKSANIAALVQGVLVNNPELAKSLQDGGAQAYDAWAKGIGEQANKLSINIGNATLFSDEQVMAGMSILAKSGVDINDIFGGVANTMAEIAMIGDTDIPTAARHMVSLYNQFGRQLKDTAQFDSVGEAFEHVSDVIANSLLSSGMNLNEFMTSLSYAGAPAAQAGQTLDQTAATIALFAKNGLLGSKAGTALRRIITNIVPSSERAAEAVRILTKETGGTADAFYDAHGKMLPLVEVQEKLAAGLEGLTDQQRVAVLRDMFGQWAIGGSLILGSAQNFGDFTKQIGQTGTAQNYVNAIMASSKGINDRMTESWNNLAETMGNTNLKYLDPLKDSFSDLIANYLNETPQATQDTIATMIGLTAVFATGAGSILETAANIGIFALSLKMAGISLGAVASTGGIVLLVIAGIAAIAYVAYKAWDENWGGIQQKTEEVVNVVKTKVGEMRKAIEDEWDVLGPQLQTTWETRLKPIWEDVATWWGAHGAPTVRIAIDAFLKSLTEGFEGLGRMISGVWKMVTGAIETVIGVINALKTGDWQAAWDGIVKVVTGAWDLLVGFFSGLGGALWAIIEPIVKAVVDGLGGNYDQIKADFLAWWDDFKKTFETSWNFVKSIVLAVVSAMKGDWDGALDHIASAAGTKKETVLAKFNEIIDGIRSAFTSLISSAASWGSNLVSSIADGISGAIDKVKNAAKDVADTIAKFLGVHSPTAMGPMSDLDRWMPNMMREFVDGIDAYRPSLQMAVGSVAGDISVGIGGATSGVNVGRRGNGGANYNVTVVYQGNGRGDDFERFARTVTNAITSL